MHTGLCALQVEQAGALRDRQVGNLLNATSITFYGGHQPYKMYLTTAYTQYRYNDGYELKISTWFFV